MKRRKHSGPLTAYTSKAGQLGTKPRSPDDVVRVLTEQAGQSEIRKKAVVAGERRRTGAKSKQPPLSEEMKTVTEIGGRRWKPGQTK